VGDALTPGASDPTGNQPTMGDHVDHRQLFDQPERVFPDGQDIAQQDDFRSLGNLGKNGCLDVHRAAHAEGCAVMLVEHEAVETHLLRVHTLIEVAVVQVCANLGIVNLVAESQVFDGQASGTEVAGCWVLVWPFCKVSYEHLRLLGLHLAIAVAYDALWGATVSNLF